MKTFHWPVRPNVSEKADPKVNVIKFGDGYEQRIKKDINNDLRFYNIELKVLNEEAVYIDNFLSEHGAVEPFLWREPNKHRYIKVKCTSWNSNIDNIVTTIKATFEQVVA